MRTHSIALVVAITLLISSCHDDSSTAPHSYSWTEVTSHAAYTGRDAMGMLPLNGRVWMLGGWHWPNAADAAGFPETGAPGCCTTNEVWSSTDGVNWTQAPDAPWPARHMAGWVVFNNMLWVVGGDDNLGHYQSDVWNSSDGEHWTQVASSVPWAPRVLHYTLAFNNRLWVIGGQQFPAALVPRPNPYPLDPVYYSDVWTSTDGANWTRVGSLPHALGSICGAVVFDNQMWVIGGGTYGDDTQGVVAVPYNEVWSSLDGVNWTQHATAPWPPRRYHNIIVFDNQIWVLAGDSYDGQPYYNDVWYSADGENWTQLPSTPWLERHAASVFVLDNALYMTGGTPVNQVSFNDIWKLEVQ